MLKQNKRYVCVCVCATGSSDTGSYSFVGLHANSKTYDDLALPVQRRVLFAGEHTCKVPLTLPLTWTAPSLYVCRPYHDSTVGNVHLPCQQQPVLPTSQLAGASA